jgi:hypothetical protein
MAVGEAQTAYHAAKEHIVAPEVCAAAAVPNQRKSAVALKPHAFGCQRTALAHLKTEVFHADAAALQVEGMLDDQKTGAAG